jgi:hypothetical protein
MKNTITGLLIATFLIFNASAAAAVTISPTPTPAGADERLDAPVAIDPPPVGTAPSGEAGVSSDMIAPMPPDSGAGFLGQDHYYTVTLRGNGQAIVSAKVIFSNLTEQPLSTLTFTMPKEGAEQVVAYQVRREPECVRYRTYPVPSVIPLPILQEETPALQTQDPTELSIGRPDPMCEEYREPNYYDYWYGNSTYRKAEARVAGTTLTVTLPDPVPANRSASILLSFRSSAFTSPALAGARDYSFETLTVDDTIRSLQVGVETDSDLKIKGATAAVQYAKAEAGTMMAMDRAAGASSFANAQIDQYYREIGSGSVIKNASNLQAGDSYTVKGTYGSSVAQLYAREIALSIIIPLLLIVGAVFGFRFWAKRAAKDPAKTQGAMRVFSPANVLIAALVGFVSALLMGGVTLIVFLAFSALSNVYYYQLTTVLSLAMAVLTGALYLFLMAIPPVVVGVKRGVWVGVMTAVSTVSWMMVFLGIAVMVVLLLIGTVQSYPASPMMMMNGGMDAMKVAPAMETMERAQ